jgi:hypothetical protein
MLKYNIVLWIFVQMLAETFYFESGFSHILLRSSRPEMLPYDGFEVLTAVSMRSAVLWVGLSRSDRHSEEYIA